MDDKDLMEIDLMDADCVMRVAQDMGLSPESCKRAATIAKLLAECARYIQSLSVAPLTHGTAAAQLAALEQIFKGMDAPPNWENALSVARKRMAWAETQFDNTLGTLLPRTEMWNIQQLGDRVLDVFMKNGQEREEVRPQVVTLCTTLTKTQQSGAALDLDRLVVATEDELLFFIQEVTQHLDKDTGLYKNGYVSKFARMVAPLPKDTIFMNVGSNLQ